MDLATWEMNSHGFEDGLLGLMIGERERVMVGEDEDEDDEVRMRREERERNQRKTEAKIGRAHV